MTQPPQNPAPGEQPGDRSWQDPSGAGAPQDPYGQPQQPYGQDPYGQPPSLQKPEPQPDPYGGGGQQPPPYGYGNEPPYGGLPGYSGTPGGYADPAAGLASRWARLGAAIIDTLLLSIVIGLISLPFVDWGKVFEAPDGDTAVLPTGQWAANLIGIVAAFLYFWLMHRKWGQTLGKKALGIRVVRAEDRGPIDNTQALSRAGFYSVLGGICGCLGLIDVLWLLWDERKQTLHDKVAKTVVVKVNPGDPDPYAGR